MTRMITALALALGLAGGGIAFPASAQDACTETCLEDYAACRDACDESDEGCFLVCNHIRSSCSEDCEE